MRVLLVVALLFFPIIAHADDNKIVNVAEHCYREQSIVKDSDGNYLVAAIGQEHRLGRWSTLKKAKNSTLLIKMNIDEEK